MSSGGKDFIRPRFGRQRCWHRRPGSHVVDENQFVAVCQDLVGKDVGIGGPAPMSLMKINLWPSSYFEVVISVLLQAPGAFCFLHGKRYIFLVYKHF
jgi:hypothetical protein